MTFKAGEQVQWCDLDGWSGKMSPELLAVTEEKTSQPSLKKRSKSSNRKPPLFLCLTRDGLQQDACLTWTKDGALLGEYTMHSFGECPREENVSRLSAILEGCPHPKYSLSAKACQGILNRAERRGKKLPEQLGIALRAQSLSKNEQDAPGGKGILIQNERTGALSTLNNQSVYCLQGNGIDRADAAGCNGKGWREDVSYTLNTIDRPAVYAFDSLASNSMKSSNPNSGYRAVDIAKTLDTSVPDPSKNQGGICILDMAHPCDVIRDCGGTSPSLQARMGTGGNQVNAVLETYQQVTGPLMANSHPGSYCGQDAYSDMLVTPFAAGGYGKYEEGVGTLRASGGDYGGGTETLVTAVDVYNQSLSGDVSPSLTAACGGSNTSGGKVLTQTVRRLTPLECERLQGYPDGWTDIGDWTDSKGKKHQSSDSGRYKALGNSIALPFWFWLLRRISAQYERPATLGSLFDGISGFCLSWARCNGAKNCRWSSEIEEFPMAVTRKHFGDEKTGEVGDIEKYL